MASTTRSLKPTRRSTNGGKPKQQQQQPTAAAAESASLIETIIELSGRLERKSMELERREREIAILHKTCRDKTKTSAKRKANGGKRKKRACVRQLQHLTPAPPAPAPAPAAVSVAAAANPQEIKIINLRFIFASKFFGVHQFQQQTASATITTTARTSRADMLRVLDLLPRLDDLIETQRQLVNMFLIAIYELRKRPARGSKPSSVAASSNQTEAPRKRHEQQQQQQLPDKVEKAPSPMSFQDLVRLFDQDEREGFCRLEVALKKCNHAVERLNVCLSAHSVNEHPDRTACTFESLRKKHETEVNKLLDHHFEKRESEKREELLRAEREHRRMRKEAERRRELRQSMERSMWLLELYRMGALISHRRNKHFVDAGW